MPPVFWSCRRKMLSAPGGSLASRVHLALARSGTITPEDCARASVQSIREAASFMETSLPESGGRRLGKMRQEVPRQIVRRQQGRRRLPGEFAKVADQVRLVVIAAGN